MTVKRESARRGMSEGINVQYNRLEMHKIYLHRLYLSSVMYVNIGKYFNILLIPSLVDSHIYIAICISSERENPTKATAKYPLRQTDR